VVERLLPLTHDPETALGTQYDRNDEHEEDEDARRIDESVLGSGDTIVFVVDGAGQVIYNPRGLNLSGVPIRGGINAALSGATDRRSVDVGGIGATRVLSVPLIEDNRVVGAAQAIRSLGEHQRELALVTWLTLASAALGAFIAIPAGLYLARRAMQPINAAFERQRTFVADASHEFRTPLTLIRANAELALLDPDVPVERVRDTLDSILDEVDRSDRLVDDLLTLARSDAGQLPLDRKPTALADLVRGVVDEMRTLGSARQLTLSADIASSCSAAVDPDRIRQVLRILLDNAIKHTEPGGGVSAELRCADRWATIQVRDTGAGIEPEHLHRIFDRFYRVDRGRSRAAGGTGLGLPIARAIVEAHGGRITLESQVGSGTTVNVSLPALRGEPEAASLGEPAPE
jgi:signal transduction histidine kinase